MSRAHVIGAGVAGLTAAHALKAQGRDVVIYEAANYAGGRCRTFYDDHLGLDIDNGTHLLLSGNKTVLEHADVDHLHIFETARFPFIEPKTGRTWAADMGAKSIPWMYESPPGVNLWTLLGDLRHLKSDRPLAEVLDTQTERWHTFWEPMILAVLNTAPDQASARLMHAVLSETVLRGGAQCRPVLTKNGLGPAFIDPLTIGQDIRYGVLLQDIVSDGSAVTALRFKGEEVAVAVGDVVVLAVPWGQAAGLVEGVAEPRAYNAIVNVHYALETSVEEPDLLGIIGVTAQWLARRGNLASVTISAAGDLADRDGDAIAEQVWAEIGPLVGGGELPKYRVIKEKRATFVASPEADALRPPAQTALTNLALAGDWVQTGFPATLEGAARSGVAAAKELSP